MARSRMRLRRAALAGCALMGLVGAGVTAVQAHAAFEAVAETGTPGYLALRSDPPRPYWESFAPGERATWQIEASLTGAERGRFSIEVRAEGALVEEGLLAGVRSCPTPFLGAPPTCPSGEQEVFARAPLTEFSSPTANPAGEHVARLPEIHAGRERYFLLTLQRPSPAAGAGSARIGVGFHAHGLPEHDPRLLATGADLLGVSLLAAALIGAGIMLVGSPLRPGGRSSE